MNYFCDSPLNELAPAVIPAVDVTVKEDGSPRIAAWAGHTNARCDKSTRRY